MHWKSDGEASRAVVAKITATLRAMMDAPTQQPAMGTPATPGLDAFRRIAAAAREEWGTDMQNSENDLAPPDVDALRAKYPPKDTAPA